MPINLTETAATGAQQRNRGSPRRAPGEQSSGRQRFVVGMGKDGEQRSTGVGLTAGGHARAP